MIKYSDCSKELQLMWWPIHLDEVRLSNNHGLNNPVALNINCATQIEASMIRKWCKENNVYKLSKAKRFFTYTPVPTPDGVQIINYSLKEQHAIAEKSVIDKMDKWLSSLPQRDKVVFIRGFSISQVRSLTKGHNVMIISDRDDPDSNDHIISVSDQKLAFELTIRTE